MADLDNQEAFHDLIRASQCAAAARAVASILGEQVVAHGDLEQANLVCDLVGAIEICLDAAAAAHERLRV